MYVYQEHPNPVTGSSQVNYEQRFDIDFIIFENMKGTYGFDSSASSDQSQYLYLNVIN
jgi:hypothetical protein